MKDQVENEIRDRDEMLQVTENFFRELYRRNVLLEVSDRNEKIINVGPENLPEITDEEINFAMNSMEIYRAQGKDGFCWKC